MGIKVIYHDRCTDGLTSAAVAYHYYGNMAEYVPYTLEKGFPMIDSSENDTLFFLDCAPPIENLEKLNGKVIILDHHHSNKEILTQKCFRKNTECIFDMGKSGAGLTWDYFFPETTRPYMIDLVEDRDLWRYKHGDVTKHLFRGLDLVPSSIQEYSRLLFKPEEIHCLIDAGEYIEPYVQEKVLRVCKASPQKRLIQDFWCVLVNATENLSDVGMKLLELNPDAQVAIAYVHNPQNNTYKFSLRSREEVVDTTVIAMYYGGGGHKKASGCVLTHEQFMEIIQ